MKDFEKDLTSRLSQLLPPLVFRNYPQFREITGYSPRTVANFDSLGKGPKHRIRLGRVTAYPREDLVAWLLERTKIIS